MINYVLMILLSLSMCIACTGDKNGSKSAPKNEVKADVSQVTVPTKTVPAKTVPAKTVPAKTVPAKTVPIKADGLTPGTFHFDFPVIETTHVKAGDKVFYVNMKLIRNALKKGRKMIGTQILFGSVVQPGSKESIIKTATKDTVPNTGIISIPPGQIAKVGDIVVGKWAVNMTRGYITDASNPKAPKAIFIGLTYDNPAKASDKKTGIGQFEYTLKENEFMVISKAYDPGTACVYKEGKRSKLFQVWRAEGDMLLGKAFTTFKAVKKSECKPIPLKTNYKKGDKVFAPFIGTMSPAKVIKVGKGRYGVQFEKGSKSKKMISFGEVINKL
jgi:hypothetical protein